MAKSKNKMVGKRPSVRRTKGSSGVKHARLMKIKRERKREQKKREKEMLKEMSKGRPYF